MRKINPSILIVLLVSILLSSCEKEPTALFTISSTIIETGQSVSFTNTSIDADNYEWFFGDGLSSTEVSPMHTYTRMGAYLVTLVAYSKSGKKMDDAYQAYIFVVDPTTLVFNISFNELPWNGCKVVLFDDYNNWYSDINSVATATTNASGKVTFTGCSNKVYYADFYYNNNYYGTYVTEELTLFTENVYSVAFSNKQISFNNATYTPITINVSGFDARTIPVGGSTTYSNLSGSSVSMTASTRGTHNGSAIALEMIWSATVPISSTPSSVNLNVSTDFFYLYTTNSCGYNITSFYSNYGNSTYQQVVYTTVLSNGTKYGLGYHHARYNTQVRYYVASGGYYWATNGQEFNFANVNNQSVWLTLGAKSANSVEKQAAVEVFGEPISSKPMFKNHANTINIDSSSENM